LSTLAFVAAKILAKRFVEVPEDAIKFSANRFVEVELVRVAVFARILFPEIRPKARFVAVAFVTISSSIL
jgi:hypothetical protein